MIRVAFVDQHDFFHDSFQAICEKSNNEFQFVFSAYTPDQALSILDKEKIDVLITEINFPLEKGIGLCKSIHEKHPELYILVFSQVNDPVVIKQLFTAGVTSFLEKKESFETIAKAIRELHEKGFYYHYDMTGILESTLQKKRQNGVYIPSFSEKELTIVKLTRKELTNQQIATELGIHIKTVELHKRNLCEKTDSKKMIGVIEYLVANNIISKHNI